MNLSPPALARHLYFPALVLILWAAAGFILPSKTWALDAGYGGGVIVFGILCTRQTRPSREPRPWRILFGAGVVALLATVVVRVAALWEPDLVNVIRMLVGIVGSLGVGLGSYGLLGSALALREDPSNATYRTLSVAGSVLSLCGIGLFLLNEGALWLQYRNQLSNPMTFSINTVFTLLIRGCLCFSCIVAFGKAVTERGILRKQSLILKGMLGYSGLQVLVVLLSVGGSLLDRSGDYRSMLKRFSWCNGIAILLLLINSVLLSLAFRKADAGYKSTTTSNPSGGAEA